MIRTGRYKPTIEDTVELSGIETLHPGGFALTKRTAEVAGIRPGMTVLDVSSGRGTQAIYYAKEFGAHVTGIDIAEEMVEAATDLAKHAGIESSTSFVLGDSQFLPFEAGTFDIVVNECAVGIPDDSQRVLNEMLRVVKPGGRIVIHESTWRSTLDDVAKDEISERYGTTPLEREEWISMLKKAGATQVESELEPWSSPENFWKIRRDREVSGPTKVLSWGERMRTLLRIIGSYGLRGVKTAMTNERLFYRTILDGNLGYGLYWGQRSTSESADELPLS